MKRYSAPKIGRSEATITGPIGHGATCLPISSAFSCTREPEKTRSTSAAVMARFSAADFRYFSITSNGSFFIDRFLAYGITDNTLTPIKWPSYVLSICYPLGEHIRPTAFGAQTPLFLYPRSAVRS